MQTRRQHDLFLGVLGAALLVLSACSSGGDAEKGLADNGGNIVVETEADAEPSTENAGESEGALAIQVDTDPEGEPVDGEADEPASDATTTVDGDTPAPSAESITESITEEVGEVLVETGEGLSGPELEQYLARRYEAYWQAFDLARQAPTNNPTADYPALATLATGDQLELTYGELVGLSEAGHAIREPETAAVPGLDQNSSHRIRIESLESGVAELVSCLVNDNIRFDTTTGDVLNDQVITAKTKTTMAKADGTWKVIRSAAIGLDPGVSGCWLEPEDTYPL